MARNLKGSKVSFGVDKGGRSLMAGYLFVGRVACGKLPALKFGGDTRISEKVKI